VTRHGRVTQRDLRWWWELVEVPVLVLALMVIGLWAAALMDGLT